MACYGNFFHGVRNSGALEIRALACISAGDRRSMYNWKESLLHLWTGRTWPLTMSTTSPWSHLTQEVPSANHGYLENSLPTEVLDRTTQTWDAGWGDEWGGLSHPLPCDQLVHHHPHQRDPDPHNILEPCQGSILKRIFLHFYEEYIHVRLYFFEIKPYILQNFLELNSSLHGKHIHFPFTEYFSNVCFNSLSLSRSFMHKNTLLLFWTFLSLL